MAKETLTAKVESFVIAEIKRRSKKTKLSKSFITNELLIKSITSDGKLHNKSTK